MDYLFNFDNSIWFIEVNSGLTFSVLYKNNITIKFYLILMHWVLIEESDLTDMLFYSWIDEIFFTIEERSLILCGSKLNRLFTVTINVQLYMHKIDKYKYVLFKNSKMVEYSNVVSKEIWRIKMVS